MTDNEEAQTEPSEHAGDIAIVGMAGRFPQAANVEEFWANLRSGKECISFFTDEELEENGISPEVYNDPNYVRAWGWMDGVDMFDAHFFDISPREAEITDPQIRVLLETSWETLENAGCDPSRFPGRIGVFAGSSMMFYLWQNVAPTPGLLDSVGFVQAWIVNDRDFVATRVNYKLDLRGPGMTVQTACSTSLVAVHLGIQSLLAGESDMVLCGGVSAPTPYKEGYTYMEGGTFSPDGHVRTFDAKAKGMLGGNGCGLVALKRLGDAIKDGDHIRGVIKGTALNNDGIDKVTYTAPSVDGQSQCILDAMDVAGVDPKSISYVEAHGTGTPLGDPIEIAALVAAWQAKQEDDGDGDLGTGWCPIGAVKTNIGHLDTAAGVAGVIKTVLSLEAKEIPPTLHYVSPNPEIDFDASPFYVNTELREWKTDALPRRATVSSLGMGGTNAHAILEEAPTLPETGASRSCQLLLVSARTETALAAACERLAAHLETKDVKLADVAYTTQVGRKGFEQRRVFVVSDTADAIDALRKRDKKRSDAGVVMRAGRPVAFLFSGQGSQYANMARGLYERERVFREEVDRCCDVLAGIMGLDLRTLMFPAAGGEDAANAELEKTQNTQPALFVIEYALAKQLEAWGIEADAMLGHSIGEYAAACMAGVFSLEDALALVAARGRLIGGLPAGGGMMAIHLPEADVKKLVAREAGVDLATINAPELCVASGPLEALDRLEKACEAKSVSTRRLHTSHAFHSSLMDPILDAFEAEVRKVELNVPERNVVSCATGTWLTDEQATDPMYWVRHIRDAVRYAAGVETIAADDRVLVEVGPGETLATLARMTTMATSPSTQVVALTRHPKSGEDDVAALLMGLGRLWLAGADVDWNAFTADESRRRVMLPSYPFERRRYWIERPAQAAAVAGGAAPVAVARKNSDIADWFYVASWRRSAPAVVTRATDGARWLVLTDGGPIAEDVAERARRAGAKVFTATIGPGFTQNGDAFTVDPANPDDMRSLLDAIAAEGGEPTEIVHCWACGEASYENSLDVDFFSLLHLAQAMSGRRVAGGMRVDVVTSGVHDVLGDRPQHPARVLVTGPVMTMNNELEGVSARNIDLDRAEPGALGRLWSELRGETEHEVVALHADNRWALTHDATRLPVPRTSPVRDGAVVLITGGLGGIGLSLGEALAREVKAKLVLTSRSGLPARDAWDAWIQEHGEDDATSDKIAKVRRLEELGAEVMVAAADAADEEAMGRVVGDATARFGAIHGAIHAAGIAGGGIVELKTREAALAVLEPKVRGAYVLKRVLAEQRLDFVLLCSSISSVCVGLGQVDYFAANAFLDKFARMWRADEGINVVAVNWDAWSEVGMAVNTEVPDAMKAERRATLRLGIAPAEGRDAFLRILASGLPDVIVSPRDLFTREDYLARFDRRPRDAGEGEEEVAEAVAAPKRATSPRPTLPTEYVAPESETERTIATLWADLLGLDEVGIKDNFFELGGNSLVMMQVNVRLRALFGVSLPIRELFEIPEVTLLAERMDAIRMVSDSSSREMDESSDDVEEFTI